MNKILPGLILLAAYVFFDEIPDSDAGEAATLFHETAAALEASGFSRAAFCQVAGSLLANEDIEENSLTALIADNLAIRKAIQSSDTIADYITLLKNISSLMKGNEKAFELVDKALVIVSNQTVSNLFPSRNNLRLFLRNKSEGGLVPYRLAYQHREELQEKYPSNFEGFIDELGRLYTKHKKLINGVPINSTITMNPNYSQKDDTHVFIAKPENAISSVYYYTVDYKKRSTKEKFKAVKQLSIDIKDMRAQWLKILNSEATFAEHKGAQFEEAMILELIYQVQARIGSNSNKTKDKRTEEYLKTYGMSTILCEHVEIVRPYNPKSLSKKEIELHFKYPGKAAFKGDVIHYQQHVFIPERTNKIIVKWFEARLGGYLTKDKMGRHSRGKQKKILSNKEPAAQVFSTSADKVRQLFSDLGAADGVSVHKLRTLKGTMMMTTKLKSHPFTKHNATQTKVTKWLREEALQVGIQLGHMSGEKYTAATAIAHYIDPVLLTKLYKDLDLVIPKTFAKL